MTHGTSSHYIVREYATYLRWGANQPTGGGTFATFEGAYLHAISTRLQGHHQVEICRGGEAAEPEVLFERFDNLQLIDKADVSDVLDYDLERCAGALLFRIRAQRADTRCTAPGKPYFQFTASNHYQVISHARPGLETGRVYLEGRNDYAMEPAYLQFDALPDRDVVFVRIVQALNEWAYWVKTGKSEKSSPSLWEPFPRPKPVIPSRCGDQPEVIQLDCPLRPGPEMKLPEEILRAGIAISDVP